MILPGTPAWRRRVALGFLGIGTVLAARAISRDLPHEQTLIFRLAEDERRARLKLNASVTRVGETEARAGLSVARDGSETSDPRQTLRLPDGDYVLTIEWEHVDKDAHAIPSASGVAPVPVTAKESETSRVVRVTLTGGETVVPLQKRVPE